MTNEFITIGVDQIYGLKDPIQVPADTTRTLATLTTAFASAASLGKPYVLVGGHVLPVEPAEKALHMPRKGIAADELLTEIYDMAVGRTESIEGLNRYRFVWNEGVTYNGSPEFTLEPSLPREAVPIISLRCG